MSPYTWLGRCALAQLHVTKNSGQNAIRAADVATIGIKNKRSYVNTEGEKKKQFFFMLDLSPESFWNVNMNRALPETNFERKAQELGHGHVSQILCQGLSCVSFFAATMGRKRNNFCLFKRKVVL